MKNSVLCFTGLASSGTRFWMQRALELHAGARSLPVLSGDVQSLADEVRENLRALRQVDARPCLSPSLAGWVSTVALLLLVSPRTAAQLVRLFLACVGFRIESYVAIAMGLAFMLGAVLGMGGWMVWRFYE